MKVEPLQLERLHEYPIVSVDIESSGLHWYRDKLFGVAVAGCDPKVGVIASAYFDIRQSPRAVANILRELGRSKRIVNHNIKFDNHFCREAGIALPLDRLECTSIRAALIDEHEPSFSLDALGTRHVGQAKVAIWEDLAKLFGGKPTRDAQILNLGRAPVELAAKYAIRDPELAIRLWLWQEEEIAKQGLESVWDLERRLMPVIIDIEQRGVRVDEERAHAQLKIIDVQVKAAQRKLNKLAGKEVNAGSPLQMRALFGVRKRLNTAAGVTIWETDRKFQLEETEGGEASVAKKSLQIMADLGDDRARAVMTIRKMTKGAQFLKDHIIGHAVRGRVYPNYNQTRGDNELGTGTGRFSIDDPALQQIPARDVDVAAIVRSCFLPEVGQQWCCADWEQFEFRWFAHYTQDPKILAAYAADPDTDFHAIVSKITGISRNPRFAGDPNSKQINLGLVFGMGQGELAYQMGLEYTSRRDKSGREWKNAGPRAVEIFDQYHGAIPGVRKLLEQASSIARSRGYVRTILGRHIRFPKGHYHKAAGLVFQGSSADCMKLKMIELHPISKREGFNILLSVHDELDFSMPTKKSKSQAKAVKHELEVFDGVNCPIKCDIPIRSSVKLGPTWWDACKKD